MSGIDFSEIKVGDKVKLRARLLESVDWMAVTDIYEASNGSQRLEVEGGWYVWTHDPSYVEVIAHQPAPRKVEVTLGEPLHDAPRRYVGERPYEPAYAALNTEGTIYLAVSDGPSTILSGLVARQLAADILATVGAE